MKSYKYKALKSLSFQHKAEKVNSIGNATNQIPNVSMRTLKAERKVSIDSTLMETNEAKLNNHISNWSNRLIILIVVALVLFFSMYTKYKINEHNKIRDLNKILMRIKSMFASLYEMDDKVAKGIQQVENTYVYQSNFFNDITESQ